MSRSEIKPRISIEEVKNRWYEIYSRYTKLSLNGGKYNGLCPLHSEGSGSFYVFMDGGYKCFGCGEAGSNVVDFLMKKENLNFSDALIFASSNFNISAPSLVKTRRVKKEPTLYEFNDMPFTKQHHKYWNQYELTESFVSKEGDIYAIRAMACNKKIIPLSFNEIAFGYIYKDINGNDTGLKKILRIGPEITKQDKWRTNLENSAIWYTYKYANKDIDKLFIAKSNKDALCNMLVDIPSVATQSENDKILSKNIPDLLTITPNLILNFGSDEQAVNASIPVSKKFNLKWFNTPKTFLKDNINDNAEYIREFSSQCYKQLLKNKNYL
jgi:hypothetical protein